MAAALILAAILLFLVVLFLISAIKVAREYERGIIFRLGRLLAEPKGPGLFLLIPVVDRMVKVDLRTITLNIPPQEVITKDNVPVRVNAVAYFRIVEPKNAIVQVENFMVATSQIAQTTLRSVLGQHLLDELLSERDKINSILQEIIDEATAPWGVKVSIVEVKDVEIPSGMQRAMARQAEAERERRAKVIAAEGEFQASERLKDAALVIEGPPDRPATALSPDARRARLLAVDDNCVPGADRPADAVPRQAEGTPELRASSRPALRGGL
jgi:regulator of protease activity HflC (stomatin/prohibitin superfamily)